MKLQHYEAATVSPIEFRFKKKTLSFSLKNKYANMKLFTIKKP